MTATTDIDRAPGKVAEPTPAGRQAPLPEVELLTSTTLHRVAVAVFTGVPMLALVAAVPVAWIWGFLNWQTVLVGIAFYLLSG
ncbi:MAG TPA: hypothetical protein VEV63_18370, partial [Streptosporangiaceae bacterium]|nr:hypothetical protein [Streptosporangiaceae bacterium]